MAAEEKPKRPFKTAGVKRKEAEELNSDVYGGFRFTQKYWTDEMQGLADWFTAALESNALPDIPFNLTQGIRVTAPKRFYESLASQLALKHKEPRCVTGALKADLVLLHRIAGKWQQRQEEPAAAPPEPPKKAPAKRKSTTPAKPPETPILAQETAPVKEETFKEAVARKNAELAEAQRTAIGKPAESLF